jgi:hypothetical protein
VLQYGTSPYTGNICLLILDDDPQA